MMSVFCKFIDCNKCSSLMGDIIGIGEAMHVLGQELYEKSLLPSAQYTSEPKTALLE